MATDECPICLTSLADEPTTTVQCCRKVMHTACYSQCMTLKPECPMCRAPQEHVVIQVVSLPLPDATRRHFIRWIISTGMFGLTMAVALWTFETRK